MFRYSENMPIVRRIRLVGINNSYIGSNRVSSEVLTMTRSKTIEYKRNIEIRSGIVFPSGMQRVALGVEYSGTAFRGFQRQLTADNTVQAALEKALSVVANERVSLVCAGRTDAGVHATGQVVHFDTLAERPQKAWLQGVNTHLPDDIRIRWARNVMPSFHARFSAEARSYCYVILPGITRSAIMQKQVTHTSYTLALDCMRQAATLLVGEHDFTSFRASQCQAKSPVRTVTCAEIESIGAFVVLKISANAFLHHMVRNCVGALIEIGRGVREPSWITDVLVAKDRTKAAATASPHGLYLVGVSYPSHYGIPSSDLGLPFLTA